MEVIRLEAYKMKTDYTKLFDKLRENNIRQIDFRKFANISGATMNKLLHNENVTTDTICRICEYFHCMPDEIMEWIPDLDFAEKQAKKADIEAQMAELKKQLSQI